MSVETGAVARAQEIIDQNPFLYIDVRGKSAVVALEVLDSAKWLHEDGRIDSTDAETAKCIVGQFDSSLFQYNKQPELPERVTVPINREQVATLHRMVEELRGGDGLSLSQKFTIVDSYIDVETAYYSARKSSRKTITKRLIDLVKPSNITK